jgi:hypothetical protein
MKPSAWPRIIKQGGVTVRIYQAKSHGCTEYKVAHYDSEGKRRLRSFSELAEAEQFARTAAAAITKGDAKSFTITGDSCLVYFRALELIKSIPELSLDQVARDYVGALQQLGGRSLAGAIDFYLKRHPVSLPQRTCALAFEGEAKGGGRQAMVRVSLNYQPGGRPPSQQLPTPSLATPEPIVGCPGPEDHP